MAPRSVINNEEGLISNHDYVNPTWYTWNDFEDIHSFEEDAINRAKEEADTLEAFLKIIEEEEDNVDCGTIAELGVSGTVIALTNLGYMQGKKGNFGYNCIPITSCRGGRSLNSRYKEDFQFCPNVAGFATPEFGERLLSFVKGKNIGLRNVKFIEGQGFALYTQNIEDMFNFGTFLYDQRKI
jgi:hypothetical protein